MVVGPGGAQPACGAPNAAYSVSRLYVCHRRTWTDKVLVVTVGAGVGDE